MIKKDLHFFFLSHKRNSEKKREETRDFGKMQNILHMFFFHLHYIVGVAFTFYVVYAVIMVARAFKTKMGPRDTELLSFVLFTLFGFCSITLFLISQILLFCFGGQYLLHEKKAQLKLLEMSIVFMIMSLLFFFATLFALYKLFKNIPREDYNRIKYVILRYLNEIDIKGQERAELSKS
jgi:hypothetical protein